MTDILFIDDDEARRVQLGAALRKQGFNVSEHPALDPDITSSWDAIVTIESQVSPEISGLYAKVPVILLSDQPTIKASVAALQAGAKDYLSLPVSTGDLMAAIERATAYSVR